MIKIKNILEKSIIITFIILIIIFIVQLSLKLTGHSPTELQILYISLAGIIIFILGISYQFGNFIGKTTEFQKRTISEIIEMKTDIKDNKENINKLINDMDYCKRNIKNILNILKSKDTI